MPDGSFPSFHEQPQHLKKRAAIFDVDGTLVKTNAVDYYFFFLKQFYPWKERSLKILAAAIRAPYWLMLDVINREKFNLSFYQRYRGLPVDRIQACADRCFQEVILPSLVGETAERVLRHRSEGDQVLLVSGSLDFILEPLARYLGIDTKICPSLEEEEGSFSGRLTSRSMVGDAKVEALRRYAWENQIDLEESFAYSDSLSDLPLLQLVGHPVAVCPDRRLRNLAKEKGWEILEDNNVRRISNHV